MRLLFIVLAFVLSLAAGSAVMAADEIDSRTAAYRAPGEACPVMLMRAGTSRSVTLMPGYVCKTSSQKSSMPVPVPAKKFREWFVEAHKDFVAAAARLAPETVLEVKGIYDHSGKTLDALGIPHKTVKGSDLLKSSLQNVRVVVVNCPGRVPRACLQKIRDFVLRGGYLLSTDWSSDNLLEQAFPGYIQWDRHVNRQSVYDAEIISPDPSLFVHTVSNASWKMDVDSHMIRCLRSDTRVLAQSRRLAAEDPASQGALAVVFPFGRGYVLQLVAHFDNNPVIPFTNLLSDPAPVIGISLRQALAANFVVAGLCKLRIPI